MSPGPADLTIRTPRLELVTLTASFVRALTAGDTRGAGDELGSRVGRWLAGDPSHVVQLHLAERAAVAAGLAGIGRVIVLRAGSRGGRAIGSIGFSGPPDDHSRLEVSSRIHPAYRGHGYAAEAMTGLLDWATARFGITRFLVAVPFGGQPGELVPVEIAVPGPESRYERIHDLVDLSTIDRRQGP